MKKVFFNIIVATLALSLGFHSCKKDDKVKEFTVAFNSNGGSAVSSQTVKDGEKAAKPMPDPTKADNTFGGWFKETALTNAWNFTTDAVTANITLYAKWNAIPPPPAIAVTAEGLDNLKVGVAVTASIVYTLTNGEYAASITAADFAVSGLPAGLSGAATRTGATVVTLAVTGTPTTANASEAAITLPAGIAAANVAGATSAITPTGTVTAGAVAKGDGAEVTIPHAIGAPTETSITVEATFWYGINPGGQELEYAITTSASSTAPTSAWQSSATFDELTAETVYYVWVRSAANDNYNAGEAKKSEAISTASAGIAADFSVTSAAQWNDALAAISSGGNGMSYIIEIIGTVIVPGDETEENIFGEIDGLTVTLQGSGTLKLDGIGTIICIGNLNSQTLIINGTALEGNKTNTWPLINVQQGAVLQLESGSISGNGGSGVFIGNGTFIMTGGTISDNTTIYYGGGVWCANGNFSKTGGIIYGNDVAAGLKNTATIQGHAVFYDKVSTFFRNTTLGASDNISTSNTGAGSGWGE